MLSQIIAVTGVNIRSIRQRLGSSTVAVVGIAGVVLVFVAVLSIAEGVAATMKSSGDPNTAMILRAGSDTEMTSGLLGDTRTSSRTRRASRATPTEAARLARAVRHRRSPAEARRSAANVPLRGITPEAFKVHGGVKIIQGRNIEFGKNEIIAGRAATRQFAGLDVGASLKWG